MVDFKKEIKLSDLRPKPKPKQAIDGRQDDCAEVPQGEEAGDRRAQDRRVAAGCGARRQQRLGASSCSVAREPLAPGIVVGGEVRDVAGLGTRARRRSSPSTSSRARVSASASARTASVCARSTSRGSTIREQLGNAVRSGRTRRCRFRWIEAVLDYHVVSDDGERRQATSPRRVVLAAAYREPVDHFVAAFRAGGLELMGIDVEAFAMLRAVAPKAERERRGAAPRSSRSRSVTTARRSRSPNGEVCDFTRVLEWGGAKLDDRDRPRARPDRRRGGRAEARRLDLARRVDERDGSAR